MVFEWNLISEQNLFTKALSDLDERFYTHLIVTVDVQFITLVFSYFIFPAFE